MNTKKMVLLETKIQGVVKNLTNEVEEFMKTKKREKSDMNLVVASL